MVIHRRLAFFTAFLLVFPVYFKGPVLEVVAASQAAGPVVPVVKRDDLLNGLRLVTLEKPGSGKVSLRIRINSGALFDLLGKGGLADLTAGMLLRGGGGLTAKNIADMAQEFGLQIRAEVDWDATDVEISGPVDAVDTMFDLLGKVLITPSFEPKEFEALKAQRLTELTAETERDEEVIQRKAIESVFGSHPFGKPIRGTVTSVQQITVADLSYYHKKFYLANNAMLIASGEISSGELTKIARTKLGAWKKGDRVAPMFRAAETPAARHIYLINRPQTQTTHSLISQIGFSRRAEDYFAALVMSEVLRTSLHQKTGGLARLEMEARMIEGPIAIKLATPAAETLALVEKAVNEMATMQSTRPSVEQVEAAKSILISRFSEKVNQSLPDLLFEMELYGLGKDYLVTYGERMQAISPADVQRAAQKYLKPQAVSIVILGPVKEFENELKKLGQVTVAP